jgi:hypothetical protein
MLNSTNKFVFSVLVVMAVIFVARSQGSVSRTAISTQRIADAMALAGIAVSPDQIELLSKGNSSTVSATMRVVSVSNGAAGSGIVKAKLRCQDNRECLPFYVLVHGLDGVNEISLRVRPAQTTKESPVQNVVRGGDHATLILETSDSRMSFPVVCLQSGVPGQRIRAASLDRKRIYDVEVVAAGILKGSL